MTQSPVDSHRRSKGERERKRKRKRKREREREKVEQDAIPLVNKYIARWRLSTRDRFRIDLGFG